MNHSAKWRSAVKICVDFCDVMLVLFCNRTNLLKDQKSQDSSSG